MGLVFKVKRKRNSNNTVVDLGPIGILCFRYDELIGIKIPYDGTLKSYFKKLSTDEVKRVDGVRGDSWQEVDQDELATLFYRAIQNRLA